MDIAFVTGSDDRLFWNACALSESFGQMNPGKQLGIADFGLSETQRQFLHCSGILYPAPSTLRPLPHPWICKTALSAFVAQRYDALSWIDADMLAVGPCVDDAALIAEALLHQGGAAAVCRDECGLTLGEFVSVYRDAGMPVEPFDRLLSERKVDRKNAYLNTGFFIVTDPRLWTEWHKLTATVEHHVAFDQSTFNALVHSEDFHHMELDARSWNVHNGFIAEYGLNPSKPQEPTRFLHPTSQGSVHHQWERLVLSLEGANHTLDFKTFRRTDLRSLHLYALQSFVARNLRELRRAGLI